MSAALAAGSPRQRIGVVVQRYGLEVNGGAELHARQVVEVLREQHEVTVLTTRALDYTHWDTHYPEGEGQVNGVRVLRFDHPERGHSGRARMPWRHLWRYRLAALFRGLQRPRVAAPSGDAERDGLDYLERQGPCCAGLVQHLQTQARDYDLLLFFTALYYPTAVGLPASRTPALLVPTLHDERSMMWPAFHAVFRRPVQVLWNCQAEREVAAELYGDDIAPGVVCGVGVEPAMPDAAAMAAARSAFNITAPYFVFVGRVTRSKGFHTLARAFAMCSRLPGWQHQLVVVGQGFMPHLPRTPGIVYTGFVSEEQRNALMAGAWVCSVNSRHESLSLVTLEAMALGTPVLVNGRSAVLRGHVRDAQAGRAYRGLPGLAWALWRLARMPAQERERQAAAGQAYVAAHYTWARVREVLFSAVSKAMNQAAQQAAPQTTASHAKGDA